MSCERPYGHTRCEQSAPRYATFWFAVPGARKQTQRSFSSHQPWPAVRGRGGGKGKARRAPRAPVSLRTAALVRARGERARGERGREEDAQHRGLRAARGQKAQRKRAGASWAGGSRVGGVARDKLKRGVAEIRRRRSQRLRALENPRPPPQRGARPLPRSFPPSAPRTLTMLGAVAAVFALFAAGALAECRASRAAPAAAARATHNNLRAPPSIRPLR